MGARFAFVEKIERFAIACTDKPTRLACDSGTICQIVPHTQLQTALKGDYKYERPPGISGRPSHFLSNQDLFRVALEEEERIRIRDINPFRQFYYIKVLPGMQILGPQKTPSKTCLIFPTVDDVAV
jgi:hypothetical protein